MPASEVFNCDCRDYMRNLPDNFFDLAVADPPYWNPEENTGRIRVSGNVQTTLDLGFKLDMELYTELRRVSRSQIIFGANNYGFPFKGFIVWDKTNIPDKFTMSKCEIASLSENLSTVSKLFRAPSSVTGLHRIHPTQKPVELYAWLYQNYAPQKARIFDPMMGSQSSRIAAYKMGFDYVGCELSKEFFDKGCARFELECNGVEILPGGITIKQQSLFE